MLTQIDSAISTQMQMAKWTDSMKVMPIDSQMPTQTRMETATGFLMMRPTQRETPIDCQRLMRMRTQTERHWLTATERLMVRSTLTPTHRLDR